MWEFVYLFAFVVSFLLSLLLVPFFRKIALEKGIVDYPAKRKVHQTPTPLLGGAGIVTAFVATVALGYLAAVSISGLSGIGVKWIPGEITVNLPGAFHMLPRLLVIVCGGALIFLLGLIDDIRGLNAGWKLLGQTLIGLLLFFWGMRITLFFLHPVFSLILTIAWLLLITNSFNLLDNMDGLSAGTALVAALLFFFYSAQNGALFIATVLAVFGGAVCGFLRYNFPPARLFLGEAGSTFLGYFLAVISISMTFYSQGSPTYLPVLAPVFILAIPLFDTFSVMVIRRREGRSVFTAGKDHLSHRLLKFGLSQKEAVVLIYFLALGLGLPALILRNLNLADCLLLFLQGLFFLGILTLLESKQNAV